jgi:hypothetical protein
MSINISDYNYSGVFIEERNNSQLDTPAASEAVINFVPGFSKKGTVFNRPVYIKNKLDRERYFGDIDRQLEKKGSYFHRTLDIATQTAPIWAMNLLATTSDDELNYKSISIASQYDNDVIKFRQYDDFFNKAGFWQRDAESFLNFAESSERMVHLTNLSDKKLSVFMFKSTVPGFDITAENWYGGVDKVPTWMNHTDLISDYMVRVVVVRGDWSNYVQLAVDSTWSQYFTTAGLRKTQVNNFIGNSNVNLLADYNGSLIPYFRDNNNNNLFIETLINSQTDITGLYCSFDLDRVETDFATGVVDIIGHTLVDANKGNIKFMSYDETIEEIDAFEETGLDVLGNVIGIDTILGRTTANANGVINDSTIDLTIGTFVTDATPQLGITLGEVIINNTIVDILAATIQLSALSVPSVGTNSTYNITVVYVDENGVLQFIEGNGFEALSALAEGAPGLANLTYPANYANSAVVLGHIFREFDGTIYTNTYVPLALDAVGYVNLTISENAAINGQILVDNLLANNILDLEFLGTSAVTKADYAAWRAYKFFDELVNTVSFGRTVIIASTGVVNEKVFINSSNWFDNSNIATGNRRITITVNTGLDIQTESTDAGSNALVFYYLDNEFIVDSGVALEGFETNQTSTITSGLGVVAKYSKLYTDFFNGIINSGDYFYVNLGAQTPIKFAKYTDVLNPNAIGDYLIMPTADYTALGLSSLSHILIKDHTVNNGDFELGDAEDNTGVTFGSVLAVSGLLGAGETAIKLDVSIIQDLNPVTVSIFDFDQKIYLKMYIVGDVLQVRFMLDNALTQFTNINVNLVEYNTELHVYSREENFEQTLEIEQHPSYTMTDTKFLIDTARYTEVRVGDYVKAYVDVNELEPGEYKKKFVRITKKTPWSENATQNVNYSEITVDGKYDVRSFGTNDLQTMTYKSVDNYVNGYKAITLGGFTVRQDSIPDGTEIRQQEILDVIAKETPLYNALVNKNQFNFRYLIDCWGNGLVENSKQQLMDITGKRKNCLAILNMPSAKKFKQSASPAFTNADGTLNLDFVKDGGNLNLNPPFLYSFGTGSGLDDGRDASTYFFPYLTINDNGRPLDFIPAPFVANTYGRKLNSPVAGTYNWTVAAGIEDGLIRGVNGTEMPFTEDDLKAMYAMGANPIVYTKNVGYNIETEWTALRLPISALSYVHVRELLIDLENELFAMLLKYRWKFNTPQIRAKIKREADEICQSYLDRGGLYAFQNVIDETNNTPTLIDNQFGLLETFIEPVKSMGIIVNVINVQATGDIGNSTGFVTQ